MSEVDTIRQILCEDGVFEDGDVQRLQTDTFSLQQELFRINQELSILKLRREAVMKALVVRRWHMAPIHALPPEIISEILLWSCIRGQSNDEFDSNNYQLHLLRVCKKWREIAMNTPEFWSRLTLDLGASGLNNDEIGWVQLWLGRSGACSIDLHIRADDDDDSDSDSNRAVRQRRTRDSYWNQSVEMTIDKLRLHTERCRHITVSLPINYLNRLFSPQAKGLARLEYLCIDYVSAPAERILFFDLSACPRLAVWRVWSYELSFEFQGTTRAIRDIGTGMQQRNAIDLLTRSLSVTECRLYVRDTTLFLDDEPVLSLSRLTDLHIRLFGVELFAFGKFLDRFSLPSLQSLTLVQDWPEVRDDPTFGWPYLTRLLTRSRPPLMELEITPSFFNQESFIEALSCVPTLQTLLIKQFSPSNTFWQALTMTDDAVSDDSMSNICPDLRKVKITGCRNFPVGVIAEMVLSRCSQGSRTSTPCKPLASLHLFGGFEAEERANILGYPGISSCIDEGLEMKIEKGLYRG